MVRIHSPRPILLGPARRHRLQNVPETWVTEGRPLGVGFDNQQLMERERLVQSQEVSGSNYNALLPQKVGPTSSPQVAE